MSDVEFVEKEAGNLDALAGLGKPAPDSVTLLVPKGCSRETALMSVLEQVVELLLPLEKAGLTYVDSLDEVK